MSEEEVFSKVQGVLEEALGVDAEEVTREARLVEDLGAESIDFLDIQFQLEKAFNTKLGQNELFPRNVLEDPQYVQDGHVTDQGMEQLRERMPFADLSEFEKSRKVDDFPNVLTVDTLVRFIQNKLSA
jgi:acyl carrier protein